jgi:branched-subunit amino acid transport protein
VVPSVLLGTRTVEDMIQNQQLFPLVIGGIVFVKTKRADLTFVIGFLAYFTWPFV